MPKKKLWENLLPVCICFPQTMEHTSSMRMFLTHLEGEKTWGCVRHWDAGSGSDTGYLSSAGQRVLLSVFPGRNGRETLGTDDIPGDKAVMENNFPKGSSKDHTYIITQVYQSSKYNS